MPIREAVEPATIICRSPIAFEFDAEMEMFVVRDPALNIIRACKPAIMHQTIAAAARCYAEWRGRKSADIIEFPSKKLAV